VNAASSEKTCSRIGGGKFAISRQSGKNRCRRFGLGTQNDTGLAAPGERGETLTVRFCHY
jgi:hypothetical protein